MAMHGYELVCDSPWYLLLALVLPLLWVVSWRNLSGLGRVRRWLALGLRSIVALAIILALAETQLQRTSDRLTVIYLLDQSESIPGESRQAIMGYCRRATEKYRNPLSRDRVAVIVFGREPAVEVGPTDDRLRLSPHIESLLDAESTNLEAAMNMAEAIFPEDGAKRIVLVSDGNENLGDARRGAHNLAAAGIGIDVVAVRIGGRGDVAVEKVIVPGDVRRGQPFDPRVVLNNTTRPSPGRSGAVKGRLRLVRRNSEGDTKLVGTEREVTLPPGKSVFIPSQSETLNQRETLTQADFYTYEARFIPDDPRDDAIEKNNRASAYTQLRGRGRVLLIEDSQDKGQFAHFIDVLRDENLEVTRQSTDHLFTSLAGLLPYDTVILADVPRTSGDNDAAGVGFSDEQIEMLIRNTQQMGAGLVMLGGPNSFGAGGWAQTELEKAMPVDFQIDNVKVVAAGALLLVIDRSGSMSGDKLEMCKKAAVASVRMLNPRDYVGVVAFDTEPQWIVPLKRNNLPDDAVRRILRLEAGGGTDLFPAMKAAYSAIEGVKASVKHVIILTDGETPAADFTGLAQRMAQHGITTSGVAVGPDADHRLISAIAQAGGGKSYIVHDPRTIPRIFMREVRRLAMPLRFERPDNPFNVRFYPGQQMIEGLSPPPPITGFMLTTKKESPLVEVSIRSTEPPGEKNDTILASWTYGLGRAVAFTTDTGESPQRWASRWKDWPDYRKFVSKMIRWSMRPIDESGRFLLSTDVEEGRVKMVVSAWDENDAFLNDLPMVASLVGPDMKVRTFKFEQTAPGRYVAEAPTGASGSYFLTVDPGVGRTSLRSGISVPYSSEYRDHETNTVLLSELAQVQPVGGAPGKLIDDPTGKDPAAALAVSSFRHDLQRARSTQDAWHLLLFGGGLVFFCDVLFRRVQVNFAWVSPLAGAVRDRLLRHVHVEQTTPMMERLRSLKAEVGGHIESRRAAARFEPAPDAPPGDEALTGEPAAQPSPSPSPPGDSLSPQEEADADSYTNRLLKAKKKVWEER